MDNEKLNIENTETIDSIAYEKDRKILLMLISDGMDWSDINRHMYLLQSKINSYLRYRLDELPKVNTIEIRIGFIFKEPQICNEFIEKVVKRKIAELFNNIEIIVQHGAKE